MLGDKGEPLSTLDGPKELIRKLIMTLCRKKRQNIARISKGLFKKTL